MTQSIFDPTGPNTERSGSRNLGPDANQISQMPPDVVDGVISEEEMEEYRAAGLEPPVPPPDIIDMGDAAEPQVDVPADDATEVSPVDDVTGATAEDIAGQKRGG